MIIFDKYFMSNTFYNPLKFPFEVFDRKNVQDLISEGENKIPDLVIDWKSYFSDDFKRMLFERNLDIKWIQVFKYNANQIGTIHVDGDGTDVDATRLNFITNFPCTDVMKWYRPKKEVVVEPVFNRPEMSKILNHTFAFLRYTPEQVDEIFSVSCTEQALVQNKIPHNVIVGDKPRCTVSILLFKKDSNKTICMEESLRVFKDYLI